MSLATANPEHDDNRLLDLTVVGWRYDCLVRAGYPAEVAVLLAESGEVDLHDAVALLERGCPLEQAVAILT